MSVSFILVGDALRCEATEAPHSLDVAAGRGSRIFSEAAHRDDLELPPEARSSDR